MVAGASAEQMGAALAMYPHLKEAIGRMNTERIKMDGTPIQTTTRIDAVKSAEQMQQDQGTQENQSSGGGIGGRVMGGLEIGRAHLRNPITVQYRIPAS